MSTLNLQYISDLASWAIGKSRTAVESEPSVVSVGYSADQESAGNLGKDKWDRFLNRVINWNQAPGEFDEDGYQNPTRQALEKLQPLLLELKSTHQLIPDRLVIDCRGGCTLKFFRGEAEINIHIRDTGSVEARIYRNNELIHRSEL